MPTVAVIIPAAGKSARFGGKEKKPYVALDGRAVWLRAAVPVADTLKQVDPATNRVKATVSRAGLWQAQTPQVFRRDWLAGAYARRGELGTAITDDAQLVEATGHPVIVVPGSPANFKITT